MEDTTMKIIDHRLCGDDDTPYPFAESPNIGGKIEHEYLVMHYTAGSTASGAVKWLTNPAAQAAAHLVIGRDASITQLVPFDTVAWHAGASAWEGRVGLNRYSIGIELDNAGRLVRHGDRWRAWFGTEYDDSEVIEAVHKHETELCGWHTYTPEQLDVSLEVASLLIAEYDLLDVIGHEDIAPGRKSDPGPAFPMQSFRARLLGRRADESVQYETTDYLNIRTGPGTEHPTLPGSPLPTGTRMEIIKREDLWALVDVLDKVDDIVDLNGWVHTRYIKRVRPEPA
jgi:N-acetylmuramoyl-L-alanine amidase